MNESVREAKARPPIVVGQNHGGSIEHGGFAGCVPIEIPLQEIHDHYPVFPKLSSKRVVTMKAPSSGSTPSHSPPENHPFIKGGQTILNSRDWQPSDMWAFGIIIGDVLAGGRGISPIDAHQRLVLANNSDATLWTALGKNPLRGQPLPDHWREAFDFLQALLHADPRARMTARDALDHPFLKHADRMTGFLSSRR